MRHYIQCYINTGTNAIEHMAVSDSPMEKDHILAGGALEVEEIEVDVPDGEGFIRARALMGRLEVQGNRVIPAQAETGLSIASRAPRRPVRGGRPQ